MLRAALDKYAHYHNVWHRLHPNFFFTHVVWNVLVFCVALLFFSLLFMVVNFFQDAYIELLYAVAVSLQLTYLLYRNCVFHTIDLHTKQHYEDAFILCGVVSAYLLLQTVLSFVVISIMNHHRLLHPTVFLLLYAALCTAYLYIEGRFFHALWTNDRWAERIAKHAYHESFELFMAELRRRVEPSAAAFFSTAYAVDSTLTPAQFADNFDRATA